MRYLVLADVHADAAALNAVLHQARGAYDAVIMLGDYVGYGPEPVETIAMLRDLPVHVALLGNHDLAVLRLARGEGASGPETVMRTWDAHAAALLDASSPGARDAHPSRMPGDDASGVARTVDPLGGDAGTVVHDDVDAGDARSDALAWLERLPLRSALFTTASGVMETTRTPEVEEGARAEGADVHLVHGHPDPRSPFRYLDGVPAARAAGPHVTASSLAFAHTHVPGGFVRRGDAWRPLRESQLARGVSLEEGVVFWNPGGVHRARDGGANGCYALFDASTRIVSFHRAGA